VRLRKIASAARFVSRYHATRIRERTALPAYKVHEEALRELGAEREEAEADELSAQLARMPDLTKALREAPPEVQRQVFQAFELEILYDKAEQRIEITATVSEAVANAFEKQKALPKEGSLVVVRDIAGAGFEPATFGL
jgi:hypothetical protein